MPDNYTLHQRGQHQPADCLRCGATAELVDLGVMLKNYGKPYLCLLCAGDLAKALSYVNPRVHAAEIEQRDRVIGEMKLKLNEVEKSITELAPAPTLMPAPLKEFTDGIDNLVQRLLAASTRSGDRLPVPAGGEEPAPSVGGDGSPHSVDGGADDDERGTSPKRTRKPRQPVGVAAGEPAGLGDAAHGSAGSVGDAVDGASAEVDGSDVDASLEWLTIVDHPGNDGSAVFSGPAGDE